MCRIKSLPSFLLPSSCNQNPKDHTFLHPTIHLIYIFFSSISSWFLLFPFFFSFFPFLSCSLHFSIPSINHSLYFSSYFVFFLVLSVSISLPYTLLSIFPLIYYYFYYYYYFASLSFFLTFLFFLFHTHFSLTHAHATFHHRQSPPPLSTMWCQRCYRLLWILSYYATLLHVISRTWGKTLCVDLHSDQFLCLGYFCFLWIIFQFCWLSINLWYVKHEISWKKVRLEKL